MSAFRTFLKLECTKVSSRSKTKVFNPGWEDAGKRDFLDIEAGREAPEDGLTGYLS